VGSITAVLVDIAAAGFVGGDILKGVGGDFRDEAPQEFQQDLKS
jgi:hypothetical protein